MGKTLSRMPIKNFLLIVITFFYSLIVLNGCDQNTKSISYKSNSLTIKTLTPNVLVHTSWLDIPNYGRFPCNGMIYLNENEAIVFDTPTTDEVSKELIDWLKKDLNIETKGVVVTHFHDDCLGGLREFHRQKIPSYANQLTIDFAQKDSLEIPNHGFSKSLELTLGTHKVINTFFGEGHTKDNIVSHIPDEQVIFGGCMIKELGAGNGNLDDANIQEWSNTVQKVKEAYPDLQYVIPGHGAVGGIELLDYTIEKFNPKSFQPAN